MRTKRASQWRSPSQETTKPARDTTATTPNQNTAKTEKIAKNRELAHKIIDDLIRVNLSHLRASSIVGVAVTVASALVVSMSVR